MKHSATFLVSIFLFAFSISASAQSNVPPAPPPRAHQAIACPVDIEITRGICEERYPSAGIFSGIFGGESAQLHENFVSECVEDCGVNNDVLFLCSPSYDALFRKVTGRSVYDSYPKATLKAYCAQEWDTLRGEIRASNSSCEEKTGVKGSYWMGDHCKYQKYACSTGRIVDNSDPNQPIYGLTTCRYEPLPSHAKQIVKHKSSRR